MPGIRTSAITYRRGISNSTPNFFLAAQANYSVVQPVSKFINNTNSIQITVPSAPTITSITPVAGQLNVNFTAPSNNGGSSITNYQYSTNNGSTFTNAGRTTSPITIAGLTDGTTYQVIIRAVNSLGNGNNSNMVSATPVTTPSTPRIDSITPGSTQLTVNFTAPNNGGSPITNYQYSINNGDSFTSVTPLTTTSPITITGLTNGTQYLVVIRAVNSVGNGSNSNTVPATPFGTPTVFSFSSGLDTTSSDATLTSSSYDDDLKSTLVEVIIGTSCTSIGDFCFQDCTNLANVTISSTVITLGQRCFQSCAFSSITIPNSVTSLGFASFFQCGNLTIVDVPDSVTTIGASCFQSCPSLTSLSMSNSVTSIPAALVQGCPRLTSFIVPSLVTSIEGYAFFGCTDLRSFIFTNPSTINTNLIDTLIGTSNVLVTFNNTVAWANLNSFVKNYFTETPPSGLTYQFIA
jgi:hypothetical protein